MGTSISVQRGPSNLYERSLWGAGGLGEGSFIWPSEVTQQKQCLVTLETCVREERKTRVMEARARRMR